MGNCGSISSTNLKPSMVRPTPTYQLLDKTHKQPPISPIKKEKPTKEYDTPYSFIEEGEDEPITPNSKVFKKYKPRETIVENVMSESSEREDSIMQVPLISNLFIEKQNLNGSLLVGSPKVKRAKNKFDVTFTPNEKKINHYKEISNKDKKFPF